MCTSPALRRSVSITLSNNGRTRFYRRPLLKQGITLLLVYALFLQCIPGFTRVARATVLPKFVPPPVTATITDAVVSRHKPTLTHGRIEGSLRVLLGESFTINNATAITSDVYLPGSPSLQVNNGASHGGMISDGGSASPGNYALTLANNASIPGHIHTQADAPDLPPVAT